MEIEDAISTTRFNIDTEPHIRVNTELCQACSDKPCLYVCPVQNYVLVDDELEFTWQKCMECGACRIVCPRDAIVWSYPRGSFGVCFRFG